MGDLNRFGWYTDISSGREYSATGYPLLHRRGISLCDYHGEQLTLLEQVIPDADADALIRAHSCWMCDIAHPGSGLHEDYTVHTATAG